MNEIGIIQAQLAAERAHASEVANACAAVLGSQETAGAARETTSLFREACVAYLAWVLARFEERDQTLSELLASRQSAGNAAAAGARSLAGLIARSGTSREALSRLEAALGAGEAASARERWQEFARFFNSAWAPRRAALEDALAAHLDVADWRSVSAIDADSILEERNRYARVTSQLPAGIELPRPAGPG
ncbi:MAG TPA: hypothetical protein VHE11_03490 [Steroidobacteraceae bacterium]|nr:hypothetical protein [Steroidobacteraceae bacterium]